jgi:transcription elongation factor GreA
MPETIYLTNEGLAKLKVEIDQLKGSRRREIARRLRSAVQMGDLSENADYHKAKEDQAFLEGRIQEIEHILRHVVVIEKNASAESVAIGNHVTIQEDNLPAETYHLVGPQEADPRNGKISNESPIGRALADHRIGDLVEVETPGGMLKIRILKIE